VANTTVTLLRKCKTPEGWRYYPVVMSANGKVKPNTVVVDGIEVAYPVGHYVLRSYAGDKIIWTRVKGGATEALEELRVAQKRANAVAVAASAGVQVVLDPQRVSLRKAVDTYIKEVRSRKALVAAAAYEFTLNEFLDGCSKTYADELAPEDITKFHGGSPIARSTTAISISDPSYSTWSSTPRRLPGRPRGLRRPCRRFTSRRTWSPSLPH